MSVVPGFKMLVSSWKDQLTFKRFTICDEDCCVKTEMPVLCFFKFFTLVKLVLALHFITLQTVAQSCICLQIMFCCFLLQRLPSCGEEENGLFCLLVY